MDSRGRSGPVMTGSPPETEATMTDPWTPLRLNGGAVAQNRFVLAPMTTDASDPGGIVTPEELAYLRRRATSGFGMALSSCAYVHDDGRSWHGIAQPAGSMTPVLPASPPR